VVERFRRRILSIGADFTFPCILAIQSPMYFNAIPYQYSRTPFIRVNWESEAYGYAENQNNLIFLSK